ncbi:hypothetical protein GCM10010392_14460 [Streptomyces clavifer]|uniref:Uncharacterized protein n=1 Tax=Streptomyces clavifer TaxID=68188 RepID=A0ABS4V2P0_9ACTN|nr:hypothetical protein ASD51_04765 [Streptomyces sp. Root55]MBP2358177.1 hypothetical protein [Streptomyces clavifer]GHA89066.1 hypothetical protein GCM10010392_14460 [Streptomyces clavifer]
MLFVWAVPIATTVINVLTSPVSGVLVLVLGHTIARGRRAALRVFRSLRQPRPPRTSPEVRAPGTRTLLE